ncbi:MAG: helix-turn-helix transcriptional regulator [Eubacteriales bacterium]
MAREKFGTLTEQMFYTLLLLQTECCGTDIMKRVVEITHGRIKMGAGTLYTLLEGFEKEQYIIETKVEGRKRSYILTNKGRDALLKEKTRMELLLSDYITYFQNHNKEET